MSEECFGFSIVASHGRASQEVQSGGSNQTRRKGLTTKPTLLHYSHRRLPTGAKGKNDSHEIRVTWLTNELNNSKLSPSLNPVPPFPIIL